jgi:capsular exopolysaccharide synthesis family protein
MSKFFNETLKAQTVRSSAVLAKNEAAVAPSEAPVSDSKHRVNDIGALRLEECRKLGTSLTDLLRELFKGSPSLDTTADSYRALRTRLLRLRATQGLRSVVVTSATQGEGKTLTSFNLGLCCAQLQDMRVLLIDGDMRGHGLTRLLGSPEGPGLSDVLSGQCEPQDAIFATDSPNLYVMTSGSPSLPSAELLASSRWPELIGWCNETFKVTLVDAPPALSLTDVELISAGCDGILMVVRALQTKRDLLQKCARQLDNKKLLGVVYNAAENTSREYDYSYGSGAKS